MKFYLDVPLQKCVFIFSSRNTLSSAFFKPPLGFFSGPLGYALMAAVNNVLIHRLVFLSQGDVS